MALVLRLLVLVIDFPMFTSYTCAAIKKGGRHRMAETKNLCPQIDLAFHMRVCEEREKQTGSAGRLGLTDIVKIWDSVPYRDMI